MCVYVCDRGGWWSSGGWAAALLFSRWWEIESPAICFLAHSRDACLAEYAQQAERETLWQHSSSPVLLNLPLYRQRGIATRDPGDGRRGVFRVKGEGEYLALAGLHQIVKAKEMPHILIHKYLQMYEHRYCLSICNVFYLTSTHIFHVITQVHDWYEYVFWIIFVFFAVWPK